MSAKPATQTTTPAFDTRRAELRPHGRHESTFPRLEPDIQTRDRGIAAQYMNTGAALLRLPSVIRKTGLARSTIYKLVSASKFPAPIKLTTRSVAWHQREIDDWISSCVRSP